MATGKRKFSLSFLSPVKNLEGEKPDLFDVSLFTDSQLPESPPTTYTWSEFEVDYGVGSSVTACPKIEEIPVPDCAGLDFEVSRKKLRHCVVLDTYSPFDYYPKDLDSEFVETTGDLVSSVEDSYHLTPPCFPENDLFMSQLSEKKLAIPLLKYPPNGDDEPNSPKPEKSVPEPGWADSPITHSNWFGKVRMYYSPLRD